MSSNSIAIAVLYISLKPQRSIPRGLDASKQNPLNLQILPY